MDIESLLPLFDELISVIRSRVEECRSQKRIEPETRLLTRFKVDTVEETETGPRALQWHFEHILVREWRQAEQSVSEQMKGEQVYLNFCAEASPSLGDDVHQKLERAIPVLVARIFENELFDNRELLGFLLKAIQGEEVAAWSDIDVWGIRLRTKSIHLSLGNCRLLFRQLDKSDIEQESVSPFDNPLQRLMIPPDSVLRIEMQTTSSAHLQRAACKVLVLLRLLRVCSVEFGREVHQTSSPFPYLGAMQIGGISHGAQVRHGRHPLTLTDESGEKLQSFLQLVEPVLPREMHDASDKQVSYLTIAYGRYCDALFARPVEQKIAAAIMGLEALYFRPNEILELAYRLALRVSKVLSMLGADAKEIQRQIKIGYGIRSSYVHGSHPSSKQWKEIQKTGVSPDDFAAKLLDYLRISILHLICSRQEKTQFIDLLEESLVSREKDEALGEVLQGEKAILGSQFP